MFLNKQIIDSNEERLQALRSRLAKNRRLVFENITKDFNSVEEYHRGKYVEMRFRQSGFGEYPSNPSKIFRAVGDQAVDIQRRYNGRNLTESYVLKFLEEYDRSMQRDNDWNFRSIDEKQDREGMLIQSQEALDKKREEFREMFTFDTSANLFKNFNNSANEPWRPKADRPFGNKNQRRRDNNFGGDDIDGDDDVGGGGGGAGAIENKMNRLLRQLLRRQEVTPKNQTDLETTHQGQKMSQNESESLHDIGANIADIYDGSASNSFNFSSSGENINDFTTTDYIDNEFPEDIVEENAFLQPSVMVDPITGQNYQGMTPIQASSFQAIFDSDTLNSSINANVDRLRAKNSSTLAKQNPGFKKKITDLFGANRAQKLNQFNEAYSDGDDFDGGSAGISIGRTLTESNLPLENDRDVLPTDMEEYIHDMRRPKNVRKVNFIIPSDEEETPPTDYPLINEKSEAGESLLKSSDSNEVTTPFTEDVREFKPSDGGFSNPSGNFGVGVSLDPAVLGSLISRMQKFGYSQDQIDAVSKDLNIDYDTFFGLNTAQLVDLIDVSLSKHSMQVNPKESNVSSDLLAEIEAYELEQKKGNLPNLLSDGFKAKKELRNVTNLIGQLNEEKSRVKKTRNILNEQPKHGPGSVTDPYREILTSDIEQDKDEGEETFDQSSHFYPPHPPPPPSGVEAVLDNSEQKNYEATIEKKLNMFVAGTPIQNQNAMQINSFIDEIVKNAPEEKERERSKRAQEEILKQKIRKQYDPNKFSMVEVEKFDHVSQPVDQEDRKARFSRLQNVGVEEMDERFNRNVGENGQTDVKKVVENAISSIVTNTSDEKGEKQPSFVDGEFGPSFGQKSFTSDFSLEDYIRACGINSPAEFNELMQRRLQNDNSFLLDSTKLTFLPSEPQPNLRAPPISLLPRDDQQRLLGAQPAQSGSGFVGSDTSIPIDDSNVDKVVTMDVDDNLLLASQQNIQSNTLASDRNIMEETMKDNNYAASLKLVSTVKDKARFVINLMVQDALANNRIDQTMLANEDVIRYITVLTRLIEIIFEKSSTYFSQENGGAKRLEIINILTVQDSELPYLTLVHNGQPVCSLFAVSRNIFNFKMDVVTKDQFFSGEDSTNESPTPGQSLDEFKKFFYYVAAEHGFGNPDTLLAFRSQHRFRQSTMIRYQSLDPQMRTRNFFLLLDNYLLRLHVSGTTDITNASVVLDTQLQSDMYRRFNTAVLSFLPEVNARIERMLAVTPLALLLTENETKSRSNLSTLSYRRHALQLMDRDYSNGMSNGMFADNSQIDHMQWRILFSGWGSGQQENRDPESVLPTLASFTETDRPPRGADLISELLTFRRNKFVAASGENINGGEWNINPNLLMRLLMFLFIEKETLPPLASTYKTELATFFTVLIADPVFKTFSQHMVFLYRRGWRKRSLAEQAAYSIAQLYVGTLVMLIVQTLMQLDCSISNTPRYLSEYGSVSSVAKLREMVKSFIFSFDPIAVLSEESNNRVAHEQIFQHHFRQFANTLNGMVDSFERWLQEEIQSGVFSIQELSMPRNELFLRIIGAGGYEEAKENFLNAVTATAADGDEATQSFQMQTDAIQFDDKTGEPFTPVMIVMTEVGSPPNASQAVDGLPQAITTINDPTQESPKVIVNQSHPSINNMERDDLMKLISQVVVKELGLVIEKLNSGNTECVKNNQSGIDSSQSYIASGRAATSNEVRAASEATADFAGGSQPLSESTISNHYDVVKKSWSIDVSPLDSASNIDAFGEGTSTVDFNAPSQLLMVNEGEYGKSQPTQFKRVETGPTKVVLDDPELITTSHQNTQAVVEDSPNDDDGIADIVTYTMQESAQAPDNSNQQDESDFSLEKIFGEPSEQASSIDFGNLDRQIEGGLSLPSQSVILFDKDSGINHSSSSERGKEASDEVMLDPYRATSALLGRNEKQIKNRFKSHVDQVKKLSTSVARRRKEKTARSSEARMMKINDKRSQFKNTTPAGREVSTQEFLKREMERTQNTLVGEGVDETLEEVKAASKEKQKSREEKESRLQPSAKGTLVVSKTKKKILKNLARSSPYAKINKNRKEENKIDFLKVSTKGKMNKSKVKMSKIKENRKRQLIEDEKLYKLRIRKQSAIKKRKLKEQNQRSTDQKQERLVSKGIGERPVGPEDYFAAMPSALSAPYYSGARGDVESASSTSSNSISTLYS